MASRTLRTLAHPRTLLLLCCTSLAASFLFFAATTWHWRLTGDSALMHYAAFFLDRGQSPYRDLWDINFPGAYLPDWLFQHFFGPEALPWRLYDLALLLLLAVALLAIAGRRHWFAALWAAGLFAVIHGRDGMEQLGQRDLTATLLLAVGVALMPSQPGRRVALRWLVFGLFIGAASTIKPLFGLFLLLAFAQKSLPRAHSVLPLVGGFLLPWALCLAWLGRLGSLAAFLFTVRVLLPFHASLDHAKFGTLLYKSLSPILPLAALWLVLRGYNRLTKQEAPQDPARRRILLAAALIGLLCFLLQGKAFPYQRYPFLLFLILLLGLDLTQWLQARSPQRWVAGATLLWSSLYLAPASALKASRYEWQSDDFTRQLSQDLQGLGVSAHTLQPSVLCLDTISGCLNVLEDLQVQQSTPNFYDEFLFSTRPSPAVWSMRARFLQQVGEHPPDLIVVTNRGFPPGTDGYTRLATWPSFDLWLAARYCLLNDWKPHHQVRWMGRFVTPPGFRIYGRRPQPQCLALRGPAPNQCKGQP